MRDEWARVRGRPAHVRRAPQALQDLRLEGEPHVLSRIAFKGPGFYVTDNRSGSTSPSFGDKSEGEARPDSAEVKAAKPDTKSKPKSDSKPKSGSAAKKS
jgi:hypothetical protein